MFAKLFQKKTIWLPTVWGWLVILLSMFSAGLLICLKCESFLSMNQPLSAKVLVVEGWIGIEGIRAAKDEFVRGGYEWIITTGGLTGERWKEQRWSYAQMAEKELLRSGVPKERILMAPAADVDSQRTYESAMAVRRCLESHGMAREPINIFTMGVHSRRSRLIFEKARGSAASVGVISWVPSTYEDRRWWTSSERAEDMIKESAGFLFEKFFDSGRE